jgi:tetrapyrrole methylase family protein/MazG family protein/ATP diphosphatase
MGESFDLPESAVPLADQRGQSYPSLVAIMQRLLAPDGCPWDREQSYASLRKYVLEEACEVIDAIDSGRPEALKDELGDLLLQVVFLGELARRDGKFGPDDVVRAIVEKLVRRHPHVFGEVQVEGSDEVLSNWDKIKLQEYGDRGVLAGLPQAFPALARAQRMSEKVSRVGFDWPDARGSRDKVSEELGELDEAVAGGSQERIESELGDVLFALVNFARHQGVNAEQALRKTADRFAGRFAHVEARVKERHGGFPLDKDGKPTRGLPLETLDGYWNEAKEREL